MPQKLFEPYEPTDEQRRTVKMLSGFGIPQDDICKHLDVTKPTLHKFFRREIDSGVLEANAKVAQTLFAMATVDKIPAAAMFWLKARAGWREKQEIEISGAINVNTLDDARLDSALKHELAAFIAGRVAGDDGETGEGQLH